MSRFDYVRYDTESISLQEMIKSHMHVIELALNNLPDGRPKSVALTKLEEAYMWIGKTIRDHQIQRNGKAELQEERKDG